MAHDEWWTTDETYDWLCKEMNIKPTLDIAATKENSKCAEYIDAEEDALLTDWAKTPDTIFFMNPPNSELKLFVKKAHQQWKTKNIAGMLLIPSSTLSRVHFKPIWDLIVKGVIKAGEDFKPLFKRPQFLDHGEESKKGNRNDYMVVVLRKREWESLDAPDVGN